MVIISYILLKHLVILRNITHEAIWTVIYKFTLLYSQFNRRYALTTLLKLQIFVLIIQTVDHTCQN